jgi:hypothetical protein
LESVVAKFVVRIFCADPSHRNQARLDAFESGGGNWISSEHRDGQRLREEDSLGERRATRTIQMIGRHGREVDFGTGAGAMRYRIHCPLCGNNTVTVRVGSAQYQRFCDVLSRWVQTVGDEVDDARVAELSLAALAAMLRS